MAESKFTAAFCGCEGYRFDTVASPASDAGSVWIELVPDADRIVICSDCGGVAEGVHDTVERWVRDLPMFDERTDLLLVHRCRIRCPKCGPTLEASSWLSP